MRSFKSLADPSYWLSKSKLHLFEIYIYWMAECMQCINFWNARPQIDLISKSGCGILKLSFCYFWLVLNGRFWCEFKMLKLWTILLLRWIMWLLSVQIAFLVLFHACLFQLVPWVLESPCLSLSSYEPECFHHLWIHDWNILKAKLNVRNMEWCHFNDFFFLNK